MSSRYDEPGWRRSKTKVEECVSGAVSTCFRVVRVACVPAERMLGFGRRADGGIVIVREDDDNDAAAVAVNRIMKMKMWSNVKKGRRNHMLISALNRQTECFCPDGF